MMSSLTSTISKQIKKHPAGTGALENTSTIWSLSKAPIACQVQRG